MSALGGSLAFGLRISAQDDTRRGIQSALASIGGLARGAVKPITIPLRIAQNGLGLLRDINLGLAPVVRLLDQTIERGAALEVVQKNFRANLRTALAGDGAIEQGNRRIDAIGRGLVAAAHGTLRWADALRLANRAMSDGIGVGDLDTIFDFAARKAQTIGEQTEGVAGGLLAALGMGRPNVLKQFGIDIEFVADQYDRLRGPGAFDALDFASRRAMVLAAATTKMRSELRGMGVSGQETIFVWQTIKNQIGDSVDKLVLAAAKSESVQNSLKGVRDVLAGITAHFEGGGSIGELLVGKDGGASGGLLGGLKAMALDAGEALGRGILGGILKAFAGIGGLFGRIPVAGAGGGIGDDLRRLDGTGGQGLIGWLARAMQSVPTMLAMRYADVRGFTRPRSQKPLKWGALGGVQSGVEMAEEAGYLSPTIFSAIGNVIARNLRREPGTALQGLRIVPMSQLEDRSAPGPLTQFWRWFSPNYNHVGRGLPLLWKEAFGLEGVSWSGIFQNLSDQVKSLTDTIRGMVSHHRAQPLPGALIPSNPLLAAAFGANMAAFGSLGGVDWFNLDLFGLADQAGDAILRGDGGPSRTSDWFTAFRGDFPGEDLSPAARMQLMGIDAADYRLTAGARAQRMSRTATLERRLGDINRGGEFVRQRARREAGEYIDQLVRDGRYVSPNDRRRIFAEVLERRIAGARAPVESEMARLRGEIGASDERRLLDAAGLERRPVLEGGRLSEARTPRGLREDAARESALDKPASELSKVASDLAMAARMIAQALGVDANELMAEPG